MTYLGNNSNGGYQQGGSQQYQQGGYQQDNYQQGGYQQGGNQQDGRQQDNYQQDNYQQGGHQHGGNQQDFHQRGGYQQQNSQQSGQPQPRPGLSESYYSEPSLNPDHQYSSYVQQGQGQHLGLNSYQYDQRYPVQSNGEDIDGPDGERGFMGAMAGGAAGAFGGHKIGGRVGHSKSSMLIGAVAGAFSGHKLQDAASDWKDDRDEKKEKEKEEEEEEEERKKYEQQHDYQSHQGQQSHHGHHGHHDSRVDDRPRPGNYAGGFTSSSRDIRLDAHGDYLLHASCRREDGSYQHSSIPLGRHLENDCGSFRWSGGRGQNNGFSSVTIQQGDTLRSIATRFSGSFDEIARHNNIHNPDMIYPGQMIQVPYGGGNNGGGNLGSSSRNLRLTDGGQRLEGELSRNDGNWSLSSVILDERIRNFNGTLELV